MQRHLALFVIGLTACRQTDARPPAVRQASLTPQSGPVQPAAPAPLVSGIPLIRGLTLVSVLRRPEGERENTVMVEDVSRDGVTYGWRYRERVGGGELVEQSLGRFVAGVDFDSAAGVSSVFKSSATREEAPGYTAITLSRAVYKRLLADGSTGFAVVGNATPGSSTFVRYEGTLSLVSPKPEPMPMLINGRRSSVPVLRFTAQVRYQDQQKKVDLAVLADSTHPLILEQGPSQTTRIDIPGSHLVESDLERDCRAELTGIDFGFGSAVLASASDAALTEVAALLERHVDWSLMVEGHTDSVGDGESNRQLSLERATAVRTELVEHHGVASGRVRSDGFGATRPRETNETVEGRAKNRRVELVRACGLR